MSIMIFKGYVHEVETKNINGSPMFEATVKHRMGYGDNAITVFTRVAFWGQLAQIAQDKIQKDSRVQVTSEIKSGRAYITKKGEPGFGMNCKGLSFDILADGERSAAPTGGGGWGGTQQSNQQGGGGWGGGGYESSNAQNSGGGWGNQQRSNGGGSYSNQSQPHHSDSGDPVPF